MKFGSLIFWQLDSDLFHIRKKIKKVSSQLTIHHFVTFFSYNDIKFSTFSAVDRIVFFIKNYVVLGNISIRKTF